MAPASRTILVPLLWALMASAPALALPQDPAVASAASFAAFPTISMASAVALPAETPLQTPGPPSAPSQSASGQQPAGATPTQAQQNQTAPKGAPGAQQGASGHGPPGGSPHGPFRYPPSFSLAVGAAALFIGSFIITTYQFFKHKTWFMMLFPQAVLANVIACVARLHIILHPKAMTAFIVQTMCFKLVVSLIAINCVMIFTRVVWWVTPNEFRNKKHLGLPPNHISLIWAGCLAIPDIAKGIAGNLGNPKDHKSPPNPGNIWNRVQQVALVLQFFVMVGWTVWCALFMRKSNRWIIPVETERAGYRVIGWATVLAGCFLSWKMLYHAVEHDVGQNPKSYISTHEWVFWFAGQLPMLIVYTIYNVWHPGQFLPREYTRFKFDPKQMEKLKQEQAWRPVISHPMPTGSPASETRDQKGFEVTMTELVIPRPDKTA